MNKSVVLSLLVILGAYSIAGNVFAQNESNANSGVNDSRELLPIPFEFRNKFLNKMNRDNLSSIGEMLKAMAKDDLAEVAKIANKLSYSSKTKKNSVRRGSVTFALMASDFHGQRMPAIREAAEKGDRNEVLLRMGQAVDACIVCHSATRLVEWPTDRSYSMPQPISMPEGAPAPKLQIKNYKYKLTE